MKGFLIGLALLLGSTSLSVGQERTLRIICIEAHPDDCDAKMGGTAALWAAMGHQVKFLSLTNGDAGHFEQGGGVLGNRRRAEAQEAGRRLGLAEYEVLDNHDAELLPTLHVRHQVIRAIRNWDADIVIGLRPNDYHPDHRNAGKVVQDAAYMVVVPNVTPDTPPLRKNPLFLYMSDRFQRPYPFIPEIAVGIDSVFDTKVDALDAHESQFYEWLPWVDGMLAEVPEGRDERKAWLHDRMGSFSAISPEVRAALATWYGAEQAERFQHAEAFEIAEYGLQPSDEQIRAFFPMLGQDD